jgi:ligand-binding SRPBCC domain-containing protein
VRHFEKSSSVPAPAERVWERVVSEEGINDELKPWMRMTMPRSLKGKTIADVQPGEKLGRSWLLLFGFIPMDYDNLGLAELDPPRRFLERSTMASMRSWQHERTVEPTGTTCVVTDRITFEMRKPLAAVGVERATAASLERMFAHRHRRLVEHFQRDGR